VLPLLLSRLDTQDVVVYTYAAVALDRILSMRMGGSTTLMYDFLASKQAYFVLPLIISLQVFICRCSTFRPSTLKRPPLQG
jgi:hypothetical protein